mmetsp:Transcript_3958/g.5223  ORF Transcript_3958/g.5223 Transcript_3958/m.5223 type:complete len:162 (+) Transcript_3958:47-532(+)
MFANQLLNISRFTSKQLKPVFNFSTVREPVKRVKHKIPRKKASFLMNELRTAQRTRPLPYPDFKPGDALEVQMLPYKSSTKPQIMRGVVLAKTNRGIDSSFLLRDVLQGDVIERRISIHAPLIQKITVLQKAFIHQGKKRVRRAKLYYLRNLDPLLCKVSS